MNSYNARLKTAADKRRRQMLGRLASFNGNMSAMARNMNISPQRVRQILGNSKPTARASRKAL